MLLQLGVVPLTDSIFCGSTLIIEHISTPLCENRVCFGPPFAFWHLRGKQVINCHIFRPLNKKDLLFTLSLERLLYGFSQIGPQSVPDCVLIRRVHVLVWRAGFHGMKVNLHEFILYFVQIDLALWFIFCILTIVIRLLRFILFRLLLLSLVFSDRRWSQGDHAASSILIFIRLIFFQVLITSYFLFSTAVNSMFSLNLINVLVYKLVH